MAYHNDDWEEMSVTEEDGDDWEDMPLDMSGGMSPRTHEPVESTSRTYEPAETPPYEEATVLGRVGDVGVDVARGAVGLGESFVGLAKMEPTGLLRKGFDAIGYDAGLTDEFLSDLYSDERKVEEAEVEDATGVVGTIKTLIKNPAAMAGQAVQMAPGMLSIMGAARVALARSSASAIAAASAKGITDPKILAAIGRKAGAKAATITAAAAEGVQQTGSSFNRLIEDAESVGKAYTASILSGVGTAGFAFLGGKLGQKLGLGDVEAGLAGEGGIAGRASRAIGGKLGIADSKIAGRGARMVGGGIQEGLLEETPQSMQEQAWQNYATGRPLLEGVPEAGATGFVLGSVMGGGMSTLSRPTKSPTDETDLLNTGMTTREEKQREKFMDDLLAGMESGEITPERMQAMREAMPEGPLTDILDEFLTQPEAPPGPYAGEELVPVADVPRVGQVPLGDSSIIPHGFSREGEAPLELPPSQGFEIVGDKPRGLDLVPSTTIQLPEGEWEDMPISEVSPEVAMPAAPSEKTDIALEGEAVVPLKAAEAIEPETLPVTPEMEEVGEMPTLEWEAGKKWDKADATPEFWEWYNSVGKEGAAQQGIKVNKLWSGEWRAYRNRKTTLQRTALVPEKTDIALEGATIPVGTIEKEALPAKTKEIAETTPQKETLTGKAVRVGKVATKEEITEAKAKLKEVEIKIDGLLKQSKKAALEGDVEKATKLASEAGLIGQKEGQALSEMIQAAEGRDFEKKQREEAEKKKIVQPPASERVERKAVEKEPWGMTRDEFTKTFGRETSISDWASLVDDGKITEAQYKEASLLAKKKAKDVVPDVEYGVKHKSNDLHVGIIRKALLEGKPVPESVLKDYPDLQKKVSAKPDIEIPGKKDKTVKVDLPKKEAEKKEQYATKTTFKDSDISLEELQELFEHQRVKQLPDGSVSVKTALNKGFVIKFVETISPDKAAFKVAYGRAKGSGELIAGKYKDGIVTISKVGDIWTVAHEGHGHWAEEMGFINKNDQKALSFEIKRRAKKGKWESLNPDDIGGKEDRAEFIAQELKQRSDSRPTVQRIIQKIQDLIDSFVNLYKRTARGVTRDVETGKIYEKEGRALKEKMPRFMVAGKKAIGAPTGTLNKAQKMLAEGKDKEEVWKETGWLKGAEGEFKFEIDDSKAELKNIKVDSQGVAEKHTYLSDILEHSELFKNYPELSNVLTTIMIDSEMKNPRGGYTSRVEREHEGLVDIEPEIKVYAKNIDGAKTTLLHEIQHHIQTVEGFAVGGSPYGMILEAQYREKKLLADENPQFKELIDHEQSLIDRGDSAISDDRRAAAKEIYNAYSEHLSIKYGKKSVELEYYKRLAGEIEARDTAARAELTPAQRGLNFNKAKTLWEQSQKIRKSDEYQLEEKEWLASGMKEADLKKRNESSVHKKAYAIEDKIIGMGYNLNQKLVKEALAGGEVAQELLIQPLYESQGIPESEWIIKKGEGTSFSVDYRGIHTAPRKDGYSAPGHDLTDMYPDDIYSSKGAQYYGDRSPFDQESISIIRMMKGEPNKPITIYRAVPKVLTTPERIAEIEKHKAYILKTGKLPKGITNYPNSSEYYDDISEELGKLKAEDITKERKTIINPGDWVTINRRYAVEHGESQLQGKYKILKKTVTAKEIFTDANSIHEWGYDSAEGQPEQYSTKPPKDDAFVSEFLKKHGVEVPKESQEGIKSTSEMDESPGSSEGFNMPTEGKGRQVFDLVQFKIQDRLNSLRKVEKTIEKQKGIEIPDDSTAYQAEELYHGKAGRRLGEFDVEHIDPLVDSISKSEYNLEDIEQFMYARHAPEANERLKAINPKRKNNESLSGMTNEEAERITAKYAENKEMLAIADQIDAITEKTRRILVSEGLATSEEIKAWEALYKNYIPLKREGKLPGMPKKGTGMGIGGRESKQRLTGSLERKAVNILANVIAQHESTIIRAEKAKVGRAMLKLAETHPNKELWEVDAPELKPFLKQRKEAAADETTGLPSALSEVAYGKDILYKFSDNVLVVKVEGKEHTVTFNDQNVHAQRIVKSLKNLGAQNSGVVMDTLSKVNRFLAIVNTSANPEFILSNFARDIQTAGYNINDTEAKNIKGRIFKDVFKALQGIRRGVREDYSSEWAQNYKAFAKAGAQTGWTDHYKDIEAREKNLKKKLNLAKDGTWSATKRALTGLFEFVSNENTAVENAIRLSTYTHLKRTGLSEAKAASAAKNLTVNFNRRGDAGQALNAMYLFFNASAQGSARLIYAAARSPKVRKLMYGTVATAVMLDILNRAIGGEDDDGEKRYDKVPSWVKEHNLIVMRPNGDYFKLPLPWGYNTLHVLGQGIGEAIDPNKDDFDAIGAAARVGSAVVGSFNPMGSESTLLQLVSPTISDPFVQWAENKNFAGTPIKPEQLPFDVPKPEYQMYWKNARGPSKWVAKQLNDFTGGDEVVPGKINVSPEVFDLFIDTISGGAGRFIDNTVSLPKTLAKKDVDVRQIPFARRLYGESPDFYLRTKFYDNLNEIRYAEKSVKHYRGDREKISSVWNKYAGELRFANKAKRDRRIIKNLRKRSRAVEKNERLSKDIKENKIEDLEKRVSNVMTRFNRAYKDKDLMDEYAQEYVNIRNTGKSLVDLKKSVAEFNRKQSADGKRTLSWSSIVKKGNRIRKAQK